MKLKKELRVAISGKSGCGNTTVSTLLSQKLGIKLINYTFRQLAAEKGLTLAQVIENAKNDDSYDKYKNKTIFGYQTTMKPRKGKKYDTYNTNGYCFVYQYYDVSKIEKDYESLFEKIKNYISKASELLKNM